MRPTWVRPLLLSFAFIVFGHPAIADESAIVDANRETTVTLSLARGVSATVRMSARSVQKDFPYTAPLMWGGDVGDPPKTYVVELSVKVGADGIFVPLSAYGDLGDPQNVSVKRTSGGFSIAIRGGETATDYTATLVFSRTKILSREVRSGEFPQQNFERTQYSFVDN